MRRFRVVLTFASLVASVLQAQSQNVAIDGTASAPLDPCSVPQGARAFLKVAGVPAGIEYLPAQCEQRRSAAAVNELLMRSGISVTDRLDQLMAIDPRYRWTLDDGIVVIRPAEAWGDRQHFLHQRVKSFVVHDQNLGGALNVLATTLAGFPVSGLEDDRVRSPTPHTQRHFSVTVTDTTILAAMNAVVRQHGALIWEITYCKPAHRYEFATIWLRTFDNGGKSIHTATQADGATMREWCGPSA